MSSDAIIVQSKLKWSIRGAKYAGYLPIKLRQVPTSESNLDSNPESELNSKGSTSDRQTGYVAANIVIGCTALIFLGTTFYLKHISGGVKFTKVDVIQWTLAGTLICYVTILKMARMIRWTAVQDFWTTTLDLYKLIEAHGINIDSDENFSIVKQELKRSFWIYAGCGGTTVMIAFGLLIDTLLQQEYTLPALTEEFFGTLYLFMWTCHHIGFELYLIGFIKLLRAAYEAVSKKVKRDMVLYLGVEHGSELTQTPNTRAAVHLQHGLEEYLGAISSGYGYLLIIELFAMILGTLAGGFHAYVLISNFSGGLRSIGDIVIIVLHAFMNLYSLHNLCIEGDRLTSASSGACKATAKISELGLGLWSTGDEYMIATNLKSVSLNCGGYFDLNKGLFVKILRYVLSMMGIFISIHRAQANSLLKQ